MKKIKLKTERHIISYIDLLGTKEMMKKDLDGSLNLIHSVYEQAIKQFEDITGANTASLYVTIFSDNIVISLSAEDNKEDIDKSFLFVEILSSLIQMHFLIKGILVRGGIAYGNFYKDDVMIWGDSLVKAYYLENSVAIFPRIVIDPKIIDIIDYKEKSSTSHILKVDSDGITYIDYLQKDFISPFNKLLLLELDRYDDRLKKVEDIKIQQKIIWHYNYIVSKIEDEKIIDSIQGN